MNLLEKFLPSAATDGTVESLEDFLISKGCCIVPYQMLMQNPNQPILKQNSVEDFKNFIEVYGQAYKPVVFVFKHSEGSGKFSYMTLNNYFGVMVVV